VYSGENREPSQVARVHQTEEIKLAGIDGKTMAQLQDGRTLIVGHVGGDDVYGKVDQSIIQQTFRLSVEKAPSAATAATTRPR
jgi:hypothetical protein